MLPALEVSQSVSQPVSHYHTLSREHMIDDLTLTSQANPNPNTNQVLDVRANNLHGIWPRELSVAKVSTCFNLTLTLTLTQP